MPPAASTFLRALPRVILAALFAVAAIPKLLDPAAFVTAVGHYRLLPPAATYATGLLLPWLELLVALALLIPNRLRSGAWLLACTLCLAFALAHTSAWLRGLDITCGCFGGESTVNALSSLARFGLFLFALAAARFSPPPAPAAPRF